MPILLRNITRNELQNGAQSFCQSQYKSYFVMNNENRKNKNEAFAFHVIAVHVK